MSIDRMHAVIDGFKAMHDMTVKVGVFGDGAGRYEGTKSEVTKKKKSGAAPDAEDLDNAALAKIHEFGSPKNNLPARSMLNVPLQDHKEQWMSIFKERSEAFLAKNSVVILYKLIAVAALKIVIGAFDSGGYGKWPQLTRATMLAKFKGKLSVRQAAALVWQATDGGGILIRTGQLRRAMDARVASRNS